MALLARDNWLQSILLGGLQETFFQLICFVAPVLLLTFLLHLCERVTQSHLMRWFGWRGVLLTGWIGTPVHELSHAVMAVLWRRKVVELALFRPDPAEGRLGYVRYTTRLNSRVDEIGNFFIGVAPLLGGSLALYGVLWLIFPAAAWASLDSGSIASQIAEGEVFAAGKQFLLMIRDVGAEIAAPSQFYSWRIYLFAYLALCIGSHMAPSPVDYQGGRAGGLMVALAVVAGLLVTNLSVLACGAAAGFFTSLLAPVAVPLLVLFGVTVAICGAITVVIYIVSGVLDTFF